MTQPQTDWLYICLDMMIAYIPQRLETNDGREDMRQLFDHFMTASDLLTSRFQVRMQGLSGSDADKAIFEQRMGMDFDSLMQLLERTSHYTYQLSANFLVIFRNWLESEGLYESFKKIPDFPHEYLDALN